MKKFLFVIALLSLITAGCNLVSTNQNQIPVNQPVAAKTTVSYLVSPDVYTKYCNGADMDSAGYKKSLTILKTEIVNGNLSQADIIKEAVVAASKSANLTTIIDSDPNFIKINGDTAYIVPIEGWAGVSIFMCAWQPLVEVNILRDKQIKNVVWENDQQKWDALK